MKTKITLLTAAFAPLALSAHAQEATAGGAPAAEVQFTGISATAGGAADPAAPPQVAKLPTRIPRVQFENASLPEIIAYVESKAQELGLDPNTSSLNVVITPGFGIEEKHVPSISLRNVSPTEVLTIVTTVLGLQLESVTGDEGQVVAWMVKGPVPVTSAAAAARTADPAQGAVPGAEAGFAAGGTGAGSPDVRAGGTTGSIGGGGGLTAAGSAPAAVEIASSAGTAGNGFAAAAPQKQVKVFGIAQLIASKDSDPVVRQKERAQKYESLIDTLSVLTADQTGTAANIKFYEAMEIIVVKTADPMAMTLVADAIEAMKKNGSASSADSSREQAQAMRAELDALRGQLKISEAERDMTRRTYVDQIEALKSVQKLQNSDRKQER